MRTAIENEDSAARPRYLQAERDGQRLAHVLEISKLLVGFDNIEVTFDRALVIITRTLPLRSAILIEQTGDGSRIVLWQAQGARTEETQRAVAHAEDAYSYLAGCTDTALKSQPGISELPPPPAQPESTPQTSFIVIPLVVGGRTVFGALQLEAVYALDEADLMFVNAITNQLAMALDRCRAWQREVESRKLAEQSRAAAESRSALSEHRRTTAETLMERYRALVDNLDKAFVWEADARTLETLYVSAQVEELLGHPRGQWFAQPKGWLEHVHPADRERVRATFARALAEWTDQRCEHRCVAMNGDEVWLHTGVHVAESHSGAARLQGVSVDVSAIKSAERRALDQLEFTRAIAGSLLEGVLALDLQGRATFLNQSAERLLHCGRQALGAPFGELAKIRRADGGSVEPTLDRVLSSLRPVRSDEHIWVRRDGSEFAARYTAAPIWRSERLAGMVIAFEDITRERRAEAARSLLIEASQTFGASLEYALSLQRVARLALPMLGDACLVDIVGKSGKLERVAWSHIEPEKQRALAENLPSAPGAEHSEHPIRDALRTNRARQVSPVDDACLRSMARSEDELSQLRAMELQSLLVVPMSLGERRVGALTFWFAENKRRHGPEQVVLAEELARRAAFAVDNGRLYEEAQRAIRGRDQMLGVVSHDLRVPLGTILMNLTLLASTSDETRLLERLPETVNRMQRSAATMDRLTSDLLDFASIEAGRLSIHPAPHDPVALLRDAMACVERRAKDGKLRFALAVEPPLPPVHCDHDRVLQVLSNLVGNAIKSTPPGGTITLGAEAGAGEIVLMVSDTGHGIAVEDLKRIFEPYFRSQSARYKGTGLGLDIARGIVEAHGGRIWVDSSEGQGATFRFTLPRVQRG